MKEFSLEAKNTYILLLQFENYTAKTGIIFYYLFQNSKELNLFN